MADATKVINLRTLQDAIAGKIALGDDKVYDVRKLNGEQYQLLQTSDASNSVDRMYSIAAECMSISVQEARRFNLDVVKAVVTLAGQGIDAVEALFPNGLSPEPPGSTSPG